MVRVGMRRVRRQRAEHYVSETENIAKIAELVSTEIFDVFGWKTIPLRNQNWDCALHERHKTKASTHPSDVVFSYDDPYGAGVVYVTTDLKSYGKSTISKANVAGAISKLSMSTECATISDQFERLYVSNSDQESWQVVGLLFVYNHDGEYSADFSRHLMEISEKNFEAPPGQRMFVLGPQDVTYLHTVARDILNLRGKQEVPFKEECHFYYPDMVTLSARKGREAEGASLEWLCGPWQILRFRREHAEGGITTISYVYYRGLGQTTDEFKYLLDYLFRYQLVDVGHKIHVRAVRWPDTSPEIAATFEKAKNEYAIQSHPASVKDFQSRLEQVKFSTIETTYSRFSTIEIGLRDE
jgi:hypothetical protein